MILRTNRRLRPNRAEQFIRIHLQTAQMRTAIAVRFWGETLCAQATESMSASLK